MKKTRWLAALLFSIFFFILSNLPDNCRALGSQGEEASAIPLIEKGKIYQSEGNFQKAAAVFTEALALSRKTKRLKDEAICLVKLGITAWDLGEILESRGFFADALPLVQKQSNASAERLCRNALEVVRLYNLGKEYRSTNQNQKSLECFEQAIALGRETGIADFELKCLRQKSLTHWQMSDSEMFFACNKRGLEISNKINHKKEMGRCLNNLGAYYEKLSDYSNALIYLESALPVLQSEQDEDSQAECLNNIGVVYRELGEFSKALYCLFNALEIDKKIGSPLSISTDLGNIATIYLVSGWANEDKQDLHKALEKFDACFYILRDNPNLTIELQVLNNSGFAHFLLGEYKVALNYFFEALRRSDNKKYAEEQCHIYNNIASVYFADGQMDKAISFYSKSIKLSAKMEHLEILWEAYFGLGRCYEARKEFLTALSNYRKSIGTIEQIRSRITLEMFKISFARNKLVVYQHALDLLYSLYSSCPSAALLEEIFLIIEKAKARAFLESLIEARVDTEGTLTPAFMKRERDISHKISGIFLELSGTRLTGQSREKRLQELERQEEEYLRVISDMRTEHRDIVGVNSLVICSMSRVQKGLPDKRTALLEYFVGENKSYLFFITRNQTELYELPGRSVLENSLRGYLKILSVPSSGPFYGNRAAERIASELIFPLQKETQSDINALIIVPDGVLYYLPFEALRIDTNGKPSYLVEKYKVSYGLSSTSFFLLRQKPQTQRPVKNLLAFGAPLRKERQSQEEIREKTSAEIWREVYLRDGFALSSLPFSKNEVLSISRYFPAQKKDVFLDREASEAVIKRLPLREYQIIHFACHGFLDEKFPFRSALVLSIDENQDEDGFLQVREIYNLRTNADLVVLSACQSGNGALETGEGLLGLARTFFHAGAHSVLSSIWSINDQSTAGFMGDFYTFLVQGQDKSGALRLAKLKMLKSSRSHPFYWAGFVLNGDPASIQFDEKVLQRVN